MSENGRDGFDGPVPEGDEPERLVVTVAGRSLEFQLIGVGDDLEDAEGLLFELGGDLDLNKRQAVSPPPHGRRAWTLVTETGVGLLVELEDACLVYFLSDEPDEGA